MRRATRPRRSAVLELLRLEERNPPSSLLYPDGGPEARHDLSDSALAAPAASPPHLSYLLRRPDPATGAEGLSLAGAAPFRPALAEEAAPPSPARQGPPQPVHPE